MIKLVVQSPSCVWLFVNPWTAAHQAPLFFPISQSLLKFMSIEWWSCITISSSAPSPYAFSLSQCQSLCQWVGSSHQVARVLELQLQHQSFQWIFRIDWFHLLAVQGTLKSLFQHHSTKAASVFSSTTVWRHRFYSARLYGPTLIHIHDHWKNCSFVINSPKTIKSHSFLL